MEKTTDRGAVGRLAGTVGIVANAVLFAMKLAVGTLAGSVSITADALNNLSDASSSVVTLLVLLPLSQPVVWVLSSGCGFPHSSVWQPTS